MGLIICFKIQFIAACSGLLEVENRSIPPVEALRASTQRLCSAALPDENLGMATVTDGVYHPPEWGEGLLIQDVGEVCLDVLKSGMLLFSFPIALHKTFVTIGRSPDADLRVDHASTSRLHAILQFCGRAVYLADLGSTHGSMLNNKSLKPFLYHRVEVGSQFKLGQSTRSYVFNAPQVTTISSGDYTSLVGLHEIP